MYVYAGMWIYIHNIEIKYGDIYIYMHELCTHCCELKTSLCLEKLKYAHIFSATQLCKKLRARTRTFGSNWMNAYIFTWVRACVLEKKRNTRLYYVYIYVKLPVHFYFVFIYFVFPLFLFNCVKVHFKRRLTFIKKYFLTR